MDPHVLSFAGPGGARLVHPAFTASALTAEHLPRRVEHLLVDVHPAPRVALRAIRKAPSLVRSHASNVVWTVKVNRDGGRGVDFARVLESALRRGLLTAEQAEGLSPDRALDVLTREGFSTAEQVSDISGRGAGLSAVRKAVETLGGTLALDSQPGHGSQFPIRILKHHTALVG